MKYDSLDERGRMTGSDKIYSPRCDEYSGFEVKESDSRLGSGLGIGLF